MAWWLKNNLRMIQNNLRDIDAELIDPDRYVEWLKEFGANTVQINAAGITSFFPTKLDCQIRSPYLRDDFLGRIIARCRENGIRVIARFDFSKTGEELYRKHPEWYVVTPEGRPVVSGGTYATCVNSEYQRRRSLDIIREVLERYPVDGIFFNWFGYVNRDYEGNEFGICQCGSCRQRFKEMYGMELPAKPDPNDPAYRKYPEFKERTVNGNLDDIRRLVRSISPDIAVSTYAIHNVDIVRNESNSALDRPLPFWLYQSSDNVAPFAAGYDDKITSNVAINAVEMPYRYMGVSEELTALRLYENIAAGSGLDWCINGGFDTYPDRKNFPAVRKVFKHHERYEQYYGHLEQESRVLLVKGDGPEYRGIFRMLKEEHIPFTVLFAGDLERFAGSFYRYDFIILPGLGEIPDKTADALKETTACVIGTGLALEKHPELVKKIFGAETGKREEYVRATYLQAKPAEVFADFERTDQRWIFLAEPYRHLLPSEGTGTLLPLVRRAPFGPPEKAFGNEETCEGLVSVRNGKVYFGFMPGTNYWKYGYGEFRRLFLDVMASVREIRRSYETDAPEMVEIFLNRNGENTWLLQLINLTGFNGMTFFAPLEIPAIHIRFNEFTPARVLSLTEEGPEEVSAGGELTVSFARGELYRSYLIEV